MSKVEQTLSIIKPDAVERNLIEKIKSISKIPVIKHLEGICHVYIDFDADMNIAKKIILNSKLRRPEICGATETVLFHKSIVKKFVNPVLSNLKNQGCNIYSDKIIKKLFKGKSKLILNKNWAKEYLSANISAKVVGNVKNAAKANDSNAIE